MVDSVKKKSTYTEVTVKFIPGGVNFADHMEVGLVKDNDITISKDKDGNVNVKKEEIICGQTIDENGGQYCA